MDKIKILEMLYYLAGCGYGDNTIWETIHKLNFNEDTILDALAEQERINRHELHTDFPNEGLQQAEEIVSRICRLEPKK